MERPVEALLDEHFVASADERRLGLGELEPLSLVLDSEVVADGAGVTDREDTRQLRVLGAGKLPVAAAALSGQHRETGVEVREERFEEEAVRLFDRRDPPEPKLLDEPILQGSEDALRSEEHTSELQSQFHLVCRLLL